ncbi:hypothetical protein PSTEL_07030 [Paenibacillus stellifer]|uniref:Uncharacterized protein n=1 Tax=Paenibacillus stellifer TaxID=169760 RepID=A0A089LN13_9BACL|nr:hypothetical protein PSTEL_07030 [Paenibacillus stellifer]
MGQYNFRLGQEEMQRMATKSPSEAKKLPAGGIHTAAGSSMGYGELGGYRRNPTASVRKLLGI